MIRIDASLAGHLPTGHARWRGYGAVHPHHAYVFANKRANRIRVLVHDGIGIWLAALNRNDRGGDLFPAWLCSY